MNYYIVVCETDAELCIRGPYLDWQKSQDKMSELHRGHGNGVRFARIYVFGHDPSDQEVLDRLAERPDSWCAEIEIHREDPIWAKAQELAARPYSEVIYSDQMSDTRIYVAYNPELRGCMAQGWCPDSASGNLDEARIDYIESLLQDGLPVPEPDYHRLRFAAVWDED